MPKSCQILAETGLKRFGSLFCAEFVKKLLIYLKGISTEKSFTLCNEVVYSIKSAGLGYQGKVFSVKLRL